jgi:hypothetical protein
MCKILRKVVEIQIYGCKRAEAQLLGGLTDNGGGRYLTNYIQ